jgi:hypothetical protein
MSALRIFKKKIVLCKKGDEISRLDGKDLDPPQQQNLNKHKFVMSGWKGNFNFSLFNFTFLITFSS